MSGDGPVDVAIIGGGVIGSATAYFLALRGARVTVIEADPSYAQASSALSASSIRQQFSSPVCIEMSRFGFAFLSSIDARLGVEGEPADIGLVERGYLYLATAQTRHALEANIAAQQRLGAPVAGLDPPALAQRFPWLNAEDLALGAFGLAQEGWFDGYSLLQAFRRKARALGVRYVAARASGFVAAGGRVSAVRTSLGEIACGYAVNAAGFRAGDVARWSGFAAPVAPERRCIFIFEAPDAPRDLPLVVDTSGLYVRPEGRQFLLGGPATPHDGAPPCFDVDYAQFEETLWPALAHRIPAFESLRLQRGWAGQYDMNGFDHNALIGWTPGVENVAIAAGFSGHGMQHAPAAARAVSELVLDGRYVTLDVSDLDPRRVLDDKPIRELNII